MMHCGYEGSAIQEAMSSPKALAEMAWRSVRAGGPVSSGRQVLSPAGRGQRREREA
jgi:hypothetical protein